MIGGLTERGRPYRCEFDYISKMMMLRTVGVNKTFLYHNYAHNTITIRNVLLTLTVYEEYCMCQIPSTVEPLYNGYHCEQIFYPL